MKSATKNGTKKTRGRPATGTGVQIGTRWPEDTVAAIERWAAAQDDKPGRSEAIRRLVELGLAKKPAAKSSPRVAARAAELAGNVIDEQADPAATTEEQASRKKRLVKGPEGFRDVRIDLPKAKR